MLQEQEEEAHHNLQKNQNKVKTFKTLITIILK